MTESAPLLKPIVLESQKLGMGKIGSMAMSLNGQRVYLGRRSSYERSRLNLGVLTLDAAGRPVGKPKLYPDSDVPKPIDRPSTVARIMVNPAHPRLYLAVVDESAAMKLPKNLTVYTLDLEGDPWGSPRTYDSGNPAKWVTALALHPDLPLLYLVGPDVPNVYAYNLNDEGEPHGSPLSFKNIGNTWKAKVAVSRVGERLYRLYLATAGDNKPAIEVINLDPTGTPLPNTLRSFPVPPTPNPNPAKGPLLGGAFLFHDTPQALYRRHPLLPVEAGNYWNIPDVWPLYVWPLDVEGYPVGAPQPITELSGRAEAVSADGVVLGIACDDVFLETLDTVMPGGKQVTDGTTLWTYSLSGSGGTPVLPGQSGPTGYLQLGALMKVSKETASTAEPVYHAVSLTEPVPPGFLGNQTSNWWLQALISRRPDDGAEMPGIRISRGIRRDEEHGVLLKGGLSDSSDVDDHPSDPTKLSDPILLDSFLQDQAGQVLLNLSVPAPWSLDGRKVRLRLTRRAPDQTTTQTADITEEDASALAGSLVLFFVRGYGFLPPGYEPPVIEFMSEHAKRRYLAPAQVAPIRWEDRPKQFVVSCYGMLGGQGHLGQLRTQTEALALLGINTANVYSWGGFRADQINQVLNDPFNLNFPSGITRRSQAVSAPLSGDGDPRPPRKPNEPPPPASYFDFYLLDYLSGGETALDKWAGAQAKYTKNNNGGSPDLVAEFQLSDEPAWYLPDELTRRVYQDNPGPLLDSFRKYLSSKPLSKPLSPEDFGFGKTHDWSKVQVSLLGALGASPSTVAVTQRRLFYWTVRFFHTSASQGHNRVRQALIAAGFQTSLHAYVDYNNQLSKWCDVRSPNLTTGYFDFFTSARLGAHMPWSEDVGVHGGDPHDDQAAQLWSVSGDLLRSASMLMPAGTEYVPAEFGGYVHGNNLVSHPAGASYKIFSLIGHGAKFVKLYTFGPVQFDPSNGWSENTGAYSAIAQALRLLGRAEPVLYPGRPERGKVAILLPAACSLWDPNSDKQWYTQEQLWLHHALVHAGYTVGFRRRYRP